MFWMLAQRRKEIEKARQEGYREGYREARQEGRQEGRKEGLEEGRKEGREKVLRAFKARGLAFPPEVLQDISESAPRRG